MSGHAPTPGGLTISSALIDRTVEVSLQGELDLASAPRLEERMVAIDDDDPVRVLIDLAGLKFIDSTGLRVLLLADARARERGYELLLRAGGETVQRVFEMTGALDVLRFES
jgi:stage II sporulation protein AA (anti-sigma F factor antagonist)